MKLIVGLGNVGELYRSNRHNIGFMTVEQYARDHQLQFQDKQKFSAAIAASEGFILARPTTMMNNSGLAVRKLSDYYDIPPEDILVIYDELAIEFGVIRIRESGESAGHNGIKSIIKHIGTDAFWRARIGIANEHSQLQPAESFVLSNFNAVEKQALPELLKTTSGIIDGFIQGEFIPDTIRL